MAEYIVDFGGSMAMLARIIESQSANLREEIVRCRDCRHYDQDGEPSEVYPDRYWCDRMTVYILPDGFCSEAKKVGA